jgi:hypothetical protein
MTVLTFSDSCFSSLFSDLTASSSIYFSSSTYSSYSIVSSTKSCSLGKKKSIVDEFSELRRSQATSGNLKYLRIFELIAFFLVLSGANDGDILY